MTIEQAGAVAMTQSPGVRELVERLEKASEPDGELEAEIWLAVTPGATRNRWSYIHKATGRTCEVDETRDKFGHLISVPRYTESIDAALTLVPEGFRWKLGYSRYVPCGAELTDYRDPAKFHVLGRFDGECDSNHAIALCIAALRARSALHPTGTEKSDA